MKTINKNTCHYPAGLDNPEKGNSHFTRYSGQARVGQNKKAFTLVELIIVITILAILAIIAFISFQNYTKDARDGNRVATIKNIENGIDIYSIKTGNPPQPEGEIIQVMGSGGTNGVTLWTKGTLSDTVSRQIQMNKTPLDPYSKTEYVYATTPRGEYQVGTTLENLQAKVVGNYTPRFFETDTMRYFVPSLIFTGTGYLNGEIKLFDENVKIYYVTDRDTNLPYAVGKSVSENKEMKDLTLVKEIIEKVKEKLENESDKNQVESYFTQTGTGKNKGDTEDDPIYNTIKETTGSSPSNTPASSAPTTVNETCGTAHNLSTPTQPTEDLCTNGNPTSVTENTGNYTWSCEGINAGNPANCSAPRQYTITFNGNGSTSGSMTAQNITANTSANLTTNGFTRTGYTFLGWNTNQSATTATHTNQASYSMGTANVQLYAIWQSSWSCGEIVLGPNGEDYTTTLGPDGKCWTSTNMKHTPVRGSSWCYNNDTNLCDSEGRLYSWYVAMGLDEGSTSTTEANDSVCKVLGTEWALPTDDQWTALTNALATGWTGNKLSGIVSALPGYRDTDGSFANRGSYGYWWSGTQDDSVYSWYRYLNSGRSTVGRHGDDKATGSSVVCIKN